MDLECEPQLFQVNLGRAARTDAGVHAAGNIVSMKMITQIPGVDDIVARVNDELPPEIRLWSYVSRVLRLSVPLMVIPTHRSVYRTPSMPERKLHDVWTFHKSSADIS